MTEANLALARELVEAFNSGGLDALREYADPEIEFHEPAVLEQALPRVVRGVDAAGDVLRKFNSEWESHRTEIEELRTLDEDRVLLASIEHFTGRDGMKVAAPAAAILTFRDGKVLRWQAFWDRASGFAAAGLNAGDA